MKSYYSDAEIDPAEVRRREERSAMAIATLILAVIIFVPLGLTIWFDEPRWLLGWLLLIFFMS